MSEQSSCSKFRELPELAVRLCAKAGAPPRLVTHLTIVHDVAVSFCQSLDARYPNLEYDGETVHLGAALHDIGKAFHPEELSGQGNQHENAGEQFLMKEGVPHAVARIARTHGQWRGEVSPFLEDLLVALADKVWRGARDEQLETLIVNNLSTVTAVQAWEAYSALDRIVRSIAVNADTRIHIARTFGKFTDR